jgi:hypothetical protein
MCTRLSAPGVWANSFSVIGAVAIVVAVIAVAANTHAITRAVKFTGVAPTTDEAEIDLGEPGPSLGDLLVFSGPLLNQDREMIGRIDGHCRVTSSPGPSAEHRRQCLVATTFHEQQGSELQAQGIGRLEAEDGILSITGGSGVYQNARRQATFDYRTQGRVIITYELIP